MQLLEHLLRRFLLAFFLIRANHVRRMRADFQREHMLVMFHTRITQINLRVTVCCIAFETFLESIGSMEEDGDESTCKM
jgi:hypothetical protein